MRKELEKHCHKWITCLQAKTKTMPLGLYTHLPIASFLLEEISMDFILGLSKT